MPGLHEAELAYLHDHEWAKTADDVLWRRSKLGLHLSPAQRATVADWCAAHWPEVGATALAEDGAGMKLRLERVEQRVGAETCLYPLDLDARAATR